MNNAKIDRDLAKLELAKRRSQERLDRQQERINLRFERIQERLEAKVGKPSVSQQRIIEAALELLREDGLASLTQRKLAKKLDMQAPALYWHFKNKEVLIDYMAEAILQKKFKNLQPKADDQLWQDWLTDHMMQLRKAMLAYKDGARVVAGAHLYPAVTLAQSLECGLISLSSAGLSLKQARIIMVTATSYTFGYVIEEQAAPTEEQIAKINIAEFLKPYPFMAKSIGEIDRGRHARNKDYLAGLQLIINGSA